MKWLVMNLALALAWTIFTARFGAANFIFGFVLGYLALWLSARAIGGPRPYFHSLRRLLELIVVFHWQLLLANLRVAYDVITPRLHMRPGVVGIPLEPMSDIRITLLANLITLTPGSLTLDISADRRTLYLHVMYLTDPEDLRRKIKDSLERRLLEI